MLFLFTSCFNDIFPRLSDYVRGEMFIHLGQGSSNLILEGRCPAEFSSNLPQHTCLDVWSIPSKTLISFFRCVWLGLELNSAGHRPSKTELGDPWSRLYSVLKHVIKRKGWSRSLELCCQSWGVYTAICHAIYCLNFLKLKKSCICSVHVNKNTCTAIIYTQDGLRVSKSWGHFNFCMNYPFKNQCKY